ncbi:MAG TPA: sulfite exporter TauE/SafE family protein [Thermodesulfovibrionales bacterium]|nr:sulfite exporter TauE/SafE family protein [Thermodesulfovibrionales bacterium]
MVSQKAIAKKRDGYGWKFLILMLAIFVVHVSVITVFASTDGPPAPPAVQSAMPWWAWPLILFIVTFLLGIVAVLGGVGGGVLFVPIIGGFFPFHIDFVRGAGLLVALAGALAAGPGLLKKAMADLRLALPVALIASACAIVGAMLGLALPSNVVNTALGGTILGIVLIMLMAKKSEYPEVREADALSTALRINGIYHEASTGQDINWKIHRTPQGLATFILIGIMAGMFGLGAGWANVPVLNIMMGAPLKVSVATSKFLLSITDTSAAWIYVNNGAVLPMMVVPSIIGIMLGSIVGVRILARTKPAAVRYIVIAMLLFAGLRALLKGLGIWK